MGSDRTLPPDRDIGRLRSNSPSPGVLAAFIEEAGAPVELLQFLNDA